MTVSGPVGLREPVERAITDWQRAGGPPQEDLWLTVTPTGQRIWFTDLRLRRQVATAATDQGLADLKALATALAPTLAAQRAALDELLETFSQVGGTLATRTAQAEADAQRARAEVADAIQRAAAADADKVRALRAAREEKEAAARAQARARAAERAAEDSAANERAALRDHAVVAADLAQATERLATARRDKVTAEQARDTLATHLTAAQESHAREAGRLRDQLRTLQEAGAELERRLATTAAAMSPACRDEIGGPVPSALEPEGSRHAGLLDDRVARRLRRSGQA